MISDHTSPPPPTITQDATRPWADLPPNQEEMYEKVLAHFAKEGYSIPGVEEGKGELMDEEKLWLTRECILRYLRATKWHSVDQAIKRLEDSLKWRREFGLYTMEASHVEPEAVTGKMVLYGYDVQRRPALYLIPSRQNTEESHRQIEFTVWNLERAIDLAGPGVESLVLMINFADRGKTPSLATSRTVLNILQNHYPERLGAALILNVPLLLNAFFKLITPFVDPVTRPKMKFNPSAVKDGLFTPEQLFSASGWGGSKDFVYEHDKYFGHLVKMCEERKQAQMKAWKELGGGLGLSEWDIKIKAEETRITEEAAPATSDA